MDFRTLLLLRAARETGILDAVTTDADTVGEVAAEADVTERSARVTVDALVDHGFLARIEGEGLEPTNRLLGFLTTTDLRSVGRTPHLLDVADALVGLPETMRSGESLPRSGDWTVNELGARYGEPDAAVRARVTAAIREAAGADRVLVVGDGPGTHACEFAARGRDVTLVETPAVASSVEPLLAHERVELQPRASEAPLPAGFDLVFLPRACRFWGHDVNRDRVARVHDALGPGGVAVFVDAFAETVPDRASLAAELLATTDAGRVYDGETVAGWLRDGGFVEVRSVAVPGTGDGAVVGEARHS